MKGKAHKHLYGVMAQFDNPSQLVAAARDTYEAGYRQINGYSPFPIEELSEAIGFKKSALPLIVLIGGIVGGLGGFFLQYWTEVIDYPINVGGKPWNSLPAFIPVTFEVMVLCAGVGTVVAFIWRSGLRPGRRSGLSDLRVTDDRFALAIGETAAVDRAAAKKLLSRFHVVSIEDRHINSRGEPS
jgi:hypothetical protein